MNSNPKLTFSFSRTKIVLFAGLSFLGLYWILGFDGITFSDDVYYLLAGKKFWEGNMEVNDYHFSSRWGAYVPSGLIGFLLGFDPHTISLISLLSYGLSLYLLLRILPKEQPAWVLALWFCTQVYFLHFLTKVYPDSLLVLFTSIVPTAAISRRSKPILSGFILFFSLFCGFLTKETIILLAPFPVLLFIYDLKKNQLKGAFYYSIACTGAILLALYLGYFWIKFGDAFHRISSINSGHYISEFTYADKGFWSVVRRLTVLPIVTFVERAYWAWMVFAMPGILLGWKSGKKVTFEFALAFLSLLFGFWFMSSTLEFYNPIYLNPRHLIILIPMLAMLITLGWKYWQENLKLKRWMMGFLLLGVGISLLGLDLKMAAFNFGMFMLVRFSQWKFQPILLALILIIPAGLAIPYQQNLKQYQTLIDTLTQETQHTDNQNILLSNNFLEFSEQILLSEDSMKQKRLHGLEYFLKEDKVATDTVTLLLYTYYEHAYPQEQNGIDSVRQKLMKLNFELVEEQREKVIWKQLFVKK
ncbi:hypothetical protein PBT90_08565 [Algoriphagus halophytocola]|uniref:hypothetical protein n=1 Tax=Algoriphagus halophytocola TaxID=2991499 RepID=UPI0022DE4FCB|nr:hypothetical protein [Algoriphagus sp. TR-M9]WBL44733.1 hypothetical protein PBT90_08565 [Algoriphagus sp. TR-M9]